MTFKDINYNGKVLSEQEREDFRQFADNRIKYFSESAEELYQISLGFDDENSDMAFLAKFGIFMSVSFCDCIILTKMFIMAPSQYEKRFFRGKLKVHLNESFKQLYGFTGEKHKASYIMKLKDIITGYPDFRNEFDSILADVDQMSKQSSWWKDERNLEVHLKEVIELYESRCPEINESRVVMETMPLLDSFNRLKQLMSGILRNALEHRACHGRQNHGV